MKVIRVLTRIYVNDIESAIKFYEDLLYTKSQMRFKMEDADIEIAQIGSLLLIGGPEEALAPFKGTTATFLVDSVREFRDFLVARGSVVIDDIQDVPTGADMIVKHADGTVVEYVEQGPED